MDGETIQRKIIQTEERIANYRISRCRRVMENPFWEQTGHQPQQLVMMCSLACPAEMLLCGLRLETLHLDGKCPSQVGNVYDRPVSFQILPVCV